MTEVEAAKLVAMLVTAWPDALRWLDADQQTETRRLYREFLRDLPYVAGDQAVKRLIATWRPTSAQRWPSIAELRGAITLQQHGRLPAGGEAWGVMRRLRGGDQAALEALDPTMRAALESLGWLVWTDVFRGLETVRRWRVQVGQSVDDHVADRARFIDLWDELVRRETSSQTAGVLVEPPPVRRIEAGSSETIGAILVKLLPEGAK